MIRAYNRLVSGEIDSFCVLLSGEVLEPDEYDTSKLTTAIIPGSFNPLHEGHKIIAESTKAMWNFFELSVNRDGKEFLGVDEVWRRVEQFKDYCPVFVTNSPRFLQKAGIFRSIKKLEFHIGDDTLERLIENETVLGVQGIKAKFVVYSRIGYIPYDIPDNVRWAIPWRPFPKGISSTAIREGSYG